RGIVIGGGIMLAAAAGPIIANLILRWPADFPKYLDIIGAIGDNRPSSVVRFVLAFIPLYGFWCLFWLLQLRSREERPQADLRVAAIILLLSGIAPALVSAWRVVPFVGFPFGEKYRYLLFWESAFIGMSMAATFVYAMTFAGTRLYRWAGL